MTYFFQLVTLQKENYSLGTGKNTIIKIQIQFLSYFKVYYCMLSYLLSKPNIIDDIARLFDFQ